MSDEFICVLPIKLLFRATLELGLDEFDKGAFAMGNLDKLEQDWEHLYTQLKTPTGSAVVCMVHKETKKHAYFDTRLKRFLSKQEALMYRVDVTGQHFIIRQG